MATNGSDSRTPAQAQNSSTPWLTMQHAHDAITSPAGACVNVAAGTYTGGVGFTNKGGNNAAADGYFVFRCMVMNQCIINSNSNVFEIRGINRAANGVHHIIIDGFTMAASSAVAYQSGVSIWDGVGGANSDTNYSTHHIWIINNIIHGYGQSGIQINDGEFFYVLHNTTYGNSTGTCDARGSGISMGFLKQTPGGLTLTSDDLVNPNPYIGTLTPFRNVTAWNITYNNNVNGCNQSDGNGLIMDHFDIGGTMYPYRSLVAFNIMYNNGGSGLDVFVTDNITIANNTSYNNSLLAGYNATGRAELQWHSVDTAQINNNMFNNIAMAIPGAGNLRYNATYIFEDRLGSHAGTDGGISNNVSIGQLSYGRSQYSCTTSKCNASQSQYIPNVGNISQGDMNTPPNGANFALPAGSPAIGYGQTRAYLSSQSVDAGACYHTLISCGLVNQ